VSGEAGEQMPKPTVTELHRRAKLFRDKALSTVDPEQKQELEKAAKEWEDLAEHFMAGGTIFKKTKQWMRDPTKDRRIKRGDDFSGDAWVNIFTGEIHYCVVGHNFSNYNTEKAP
jgi:hypothetical protein